MCIIYSGLDFISIGQNSQILISNLIDTFILNRGKYISKKDIFVQYMQILDLGVQVCNLDHTHSNTSFDKMKDAICTILLQIESLVP